MRLSNLTDEQLLQHAANHRKIAEWLGASPAVMATAAGITSAIEELLDRRAADQTHESRSTHASV